MVKDEVTRSNSNPIQSESSVGDIFQERERKRSRTASSSPRSSPCKSHYFFKPHKAHFDSYDFMIFLLVGSKLQSCNDNSKLSLASIAHSDSPLVQDALGLAREQLGSHASLRTVKMIKPSKHKKSTEVQMTFNAMDEYENPA